MKHIDLINSIIEAEQQAQAMAAEARDKRLHLREDLRENAENLRKSYIEQADHRIGVVREREVKQTDDAIERLNALHLSEMEGMECLYREHRSAWIDKLCAMITGQHDG